jgi:hypothetical protein
MADLVIGDRIIVNGLAALDTECTGIFICSTRPTTYTEAVTTYMLGSKTGAAGSRFNAPAASSPNGRQVSSIAITDGVVANPGTPVAWAAVDGVNSRLLATGDLTSGGALLAGQGFTLGVITIGRPATAVSVSNFVGLGDVVSGAALYVGMHAYNASKIGTNGIALRRDGGSPTINTFSYAADGLIDIAAITTFKGANNIFASTLYEQINGNNFTHATDGNHPPFSLTAANGKPCLLPDGALTSHDYFLWMTRPGAIPQPFTFIWVFQRDDVAAAWTTAIMGLQYVGISFGSSVMTGDDDSIVEYAGDALFNSGGPSDNNLHACLVVINGASSICTTDKGEWTGLDGGTVRAILDNEQWEMGHAFTEGARHNGPICEIGLYPFALDAGQRAAVIANMKTRYGIT